jgi:hypothetical protein
LNCRGLTSITFNSATTTIYDDPSTIPAATMIVGYDLSTAKNYATKYGNPFLVIGTTPKTLQSIAITTPATKLSYNIGDSLDITELVVTGTYSDGSTKVESITAANITGFNNSIARTETLTIAVDSQTATYQVQIVAPSVNTDTSGMTEMTPVSPIVVPNKVWTITLNGLVNEASINGNIYVTNSKGIEQATTCTVTSDNGISQIDVKPDSDYAPDDYILWVRGIEDLNGNKLKKQVYLKFKVPILFKEPVINLYPTLEQQISVRLNFNGKFTSTYPEYKDGWKVIAHPDGTLLNLRDNKEYPYLIWEGILNNNSWNMTKGFVVAGKDTKNFLQDELSLMGLTAKECNDFIAYWLPNMQDNKYNLITFPNEEYHTATLPGLITAGKI